MQPNRAILNTQKMFMAVLESSTVASYGFPTNVFMLNDADSKPMVPSFIISSGDYDSTRNTATAKARVLSSDIKEADLDQIGDSRKLQAGATSATSGGTDSPIPPDDSKSAALFANDLQYVLIPYFPYFGSCSFYGSQLFLYSIFETNPACKLIEEADVQPISNMKFGMQPHADTCENIIAQCSYKEDINNLDPATNYWFNANNLDTLFYFLDDPIDSAEYQASLQGGLSIDPETVSHPQIASEGDCQLGHPVKQDPHIHQAHPQLFPDGSNHEKACFS